MAIIEGIKISTLKQIKVPGGDVFHVMKNSDEGYNGFGEAYFSNIEPKAIKAWKRHKEMTLNLIVPVGTIRFVIYDDRKVSTSFNSFYEVTLSQENYHRLTVPPMVWMGFQCVGNVPALVLNIASIPHEVNEVDKKKIKDILFNWNLNK
jgi:dTDP-4-dehydrorhamnose 3,5-epimerase